MPVMVVFLAYGSAVVLSLALLYRFGAQHWYFHAAAVAGAMALAATPFPEHSPSWGMAIGFAFIFLLLWGMLAPLFRSPHHVWHRHA